MLPFNIPSRPFIAETGIYTRVTYSPAAEEYLLAIPVRFQYIKVVTVGMLPLTQPSRPVEVSHPTSYIEIYTRVTYETALQQPYFGHSRNDFSTLRLSAVGMLPFNIPSRPFIGESSNFLLRSILELLTGSYL